MNENDSQSMNSKTCLQISSNECDTFVNYEMYLEKINPKNHYQLLMNLKIYLGNEIKTNKRIEK